MPQRAAGRPKMPELPEVETVKRGLAPVMEGARILKVEAHIVAGVRLSADASPSRSAGLCFVLPTSSSAV